MTGAGKGRPAGMAILDTEADGMPRVVEEPSSSGVESRDDEAAADENLLSVRTSISMRRLPAATPPSPGSADTRSDACWWPTRAD